ncbi:hypothetical protein jhhlp_004252 [Lomentospora prolificans]|uniref:Uncharacterized protein n=1 Tax=Lomentospora prolificans TaxID=41688 RepID=A0A2N3NB26_9PEZI|nr:hypothetical protein jhhlp_004252 [Lomentospora prolificans]
MASKIILITGMCSQTVGANSGVGFSTAKVVSQASSEYHVILAGRSPEKIEKARSELGAANPKGSLSTVHLDVLDNDSIKKAAASVEQQFGRLDVLINNAGVASSDTDVEKNFRLVLETNVTGPALVSDAFRPLLQKSGNAYSIYVTSGLGSLARQSEYNIPPVWTSYCASKAALNMVMLNEMKFHGSPTFKCFCVCPGLVVSNLRGTGELERSAWGRAADPDVSGQTLLAIVEGKRDGDVGKVLHKDGVYPW